MLKILGCVLIIVSCVYCSALYSSNLKKRIKGLDFFIRLFELFKIKIEYEKCTVLQLIKSLKNECDDYIFLGDCLKNINDGLSLKNAWILSLQNKKEALGLAKSDILLLEKFCEELGETDLEGQISNITLYIQLLSKNLTELEKTVKEKSRVAINTGFFAGIIVAILLI